MPENSNDLDLILGKDFLTWLWHKSDSSPGFFRDASGNSITVTMNKRVTVESQDMENKEVSIVSGDASPLQDARFGLGRGKKVTSAIIGLEKDGLEFQLGLKAGDFSPQGLKVPKIDVSDKDDPDALILEKIFLLESCMEMMDNIYKSFIELRLSAAWEKELKEIRDWMMRLE